MTDTTKQPRTITLPDCVPDEVAETIAAALPKIAEMSATHKGIGTLFVVGTYGDHGGFVTGYGPEPMEGIILEMLKEAAINMRRAEVMQELTRAVFDDELQAPGGPVHTDTTLRDI